MPGTGNVFVGTGENNAEIGVTAWTNPGNVTADDAADATCDAPASSQYLVGRNCNFSAIPDGAIILGITVRVEASEHSPGTESLNAQLQDNDGTLIGSSKAATINGTGKSVYTYGSASDLWGASLSTTIVKSANFGVRLWFTTAHDVRVDFITIAVEYAVIDGAETPAPPSLRVAALLSLGLATAPTLAQPFQNVDEVLPVGAPPVAVSDDYWQSRISGQEFRPRYLSGSGNAAQLPAPLTVTEDGWLPPGLWLFPDRLVIAVTADDPLPIAAAPAVVEETAWIPPTRLIEVQPVPALRADEIPAGSLYGVPEEDPGFRPTVWPHEVPPQAVTADEEPAGSLSGVPVEDPPFTATVWPTASSPAAITADDAWAEAPPPSVIAAEDYWFSVLPRAQANPLYVAGSGSNDQTPAAGPPFEDYWLWPAPYVLDQYLRLPPWLGEQVAGEFVAPPTIVEESSWADAVIVQNEAPRQLSLWWADDELPAITSEDYWFPYRSPLFGGLARSAFAVDDELPSAPGPTLAIEEYWLRQLVDQPPAAVRAVGADDPLPVAPPSFATEDYWHLVRPESASWIGEPWFRADDVLPVLEIGEDAWIPAAHVPAAIVDAALRALWRFEDDAITEAPAPGLPESDDAWIPPVIAESPHVLLPGLCILRWSGDDGWVAVLTALVAEHRSGPRFGVESLSGPAFEADYQSGASLDPERLP